MFILNSCNGTILGLNSYLMVDAKLKDEDYPLYRQYSIRLFPGGVTTTRAISMSLD